MHANVVTVGEVDPLGLRACEHLVNENVCGAVDFRAETESTNTVALQALQSNVVGKLEAPILFLADRQTAGRGRHGRRWLSTDSTLTFSLVAVRPSGDERCAKLISLAVGVGVARCLEFEFAPLRAQLKWPNDVHVGGGKIAGILMETAQDSTERIVIGVGLNVGRAPDLANEPEAGAATSLAGVIGREVSRYQILGPLVTQVLHTIAELDDSADDLVDEFRERCLLTGNRIRFQCGRQHHEGFCRGVSESGELIVETESGTQTIQTGEARLIRAS